MMLMTPDAWMRGASPWCGWLRFFLLPSALIPLWFGQSMGAMMVVMAWMMVPRLFRKPVSDANWMTRAQLGVRIWRSSPLHDPRPLLMMCLVLLSLMRAAHTVIENRPAAAALYVGAYFITHLIFLSGTVAVYEHRRDGPYENRAAGDSEDGAASDAETVVEPRANDNA